MRKRIHLTESQLYGMVRNIINERYSRIALGYLIWGNDAVLVESPSDIEEALAKHRLHNGKSVEKLKNNVRQGYYIVPVGTSTYGSRGDYAVIEYFKENYPDNIVIEYGYGEDAQQGFIFGEEGFLDTEIESACGDFLNEHEKELVDSCVEETIQDYNLPDDDNTRTILQDFFYEQNIYPGAVDYATGDLKRYLADNGLLQSNESVNRKKRTIHLNESHTYQDGYWRSNSHVPYSWANQRGMRESVARRVTESVMRKLRRM